MLVSKQIKPARDWKRATRANGHLLAFASLAAFTCTIAILQPAFADDVKPVSVGQADGWESPAKLKPYVKLQPEPAATSSPATIKTVDTNKEIDSAVKSIMTNAGPDILRLRKDRKAAKRLAAYHWLDKAADANPLVIEAITSHKSAAKILANHPRLSEVAEADHYVCRRITKWKSAARVLAKNGEVKEVAALDPEGLYSAIERDRKIIRILSRNPIFDQMVVENPDLGRIIAKYM
jgi:hypothetical protein